MWRKSSLLLMAFRKNPRPVGNKKLKGEYQDFYRIRIGGYRVIYPIEDKIRTVDIRQIGHRKDIYRWSLNAARLLQLLFCNFPENFLLILSCLSNNNINQVFKPWRVFCYFIYDSLQYFLLFFSSINIVAPFIYRLFVQSYNFYWIFCRFWRFSFCFS